MAARRVGGPQRGPLICTFNYTLAGYTAGGTTEAAVGDFIIQDTTAGANWHAKSAVTANDLPLGEVLWVDTTNRVLTAAIYRYTGVWQITSDGTLALGNKAEIASALTWAQDNTNGIGVVMGINLDGVTNKTELLV